MGVCCSLAPETILIDNGKMLSLMFLDCFDAIFFMIAGFVDHKSVAQYEGWPDGTTDYGVSCP